MSITIDLNPSLEKELASFVEKENINVSLLFQQFLEDLMREKSQPTAWELGKDLFGQYGSGQGNLAQDRKKILREKMNAKYRLN